jgi:hypothetical protein
VLPEAAELRDLWGQRFLAGEGVRGELSVRFALVVGGGEEHAVGRALDVEIEHVVHHTVGLEAPVALAHLVGAEVVGRFLEPADFTGHFGVCGGRRAASHAPEAHRAVARA